MTVEHGAEFLACSVLVGTRVVTLSTGKRKPHGIDDMRVAIHDAIFVGHEVDLSTPGGLPEGHRLGQPESKGPVQGPRRSHRGLRRAYHRSRAVSFYR